MTHNEFIHSVEEYYQPFTSPLVKTLVMKFIVTYSERQLDMIFDELIRKFLKVYKPEIDVGAVAQAAELSSAGLKEDRSAGGEVMYDGRLIGHYDSGRFIPAVYVLDSETKKKYIEGWRQYSRPELFLDLVRESENRKIGFDEKRFLEKQVISRIDGESGEVSK